jgi:aldose sugar dehydrogenase
LEEVEMKKIVLLIVLLGAWSLLIAAAPAPEPGQTETLRTDEQGIEVRMETLVSGLNHPWGMAFLPDDRLLVTERNTGNLYILGTDHTLSDPLQGVPEVVAEGQGGLLDVTLDPDFERNGLVYLSYAKPMGDGMSTTALGRGRLAENSIEEFQDIFVMEPPYERAAHFGNRIVFSPDGRYLFLGLGERFQFDPAQDLSSHLGKVIRIHPDGSVPEDNPFVDREDALGEIWSLGHRNIQAMAFQPGTGALWAGEMGPRGGDELNIIQPGENYGWPEVSWGEHYDGRAIPDPPTRPEFKDAVRHWTPAVSPSGMVFYQGEMFPEWNGNALIGGLTRREIVILSFKNTEVVGEDRLQMPERIRNVKEAPDGSIFVLTDVDDGKVLRLTPAQASAGSGCKQ